MKLKILLLCIATLLSSNLTAKKIVMTPTVGKQLSTPDKDFADDEVLIGLGIRAHLNKNYAVDMKFATSKMNLMGDGGKSDLERGSVNLYYDIYPDAKVSPFLFAGAGYEKLHRVYKNVKSQAFYQAGTGVRIDLTKSIELSAEAKYLKKSKTKTKELIATLGIGAILGNNCETDRVLTTSKKLPPKTYQNIVKKTKLTAKPAIAVKQNKENFFSDEVSYANNTKQTTKTYSKKARSGNYIQIASLHDRTNIKKLINSLKNSGYKIKLLKRSKLTTVLVGPYNRSKISHIYSKIKYQHRDAFYKKL